MTLSSDRAADVPQRFRVRTKDGVKANSAKGEYDYGCYFPDTDLGVTNMGTRGTGRPTGVEWLEATVDGDQWLSEEKTSEAGSTVHAERFLGPGGSADAAASNAAALLNGFLTGRLGFYAESSLSIGEIVEHVAKGAPVKPGMILRVCSLPRSRKVAAAEFGQPAREIEIGQPRKPGDEPTMEEMLSVGGSYVQALWWPPFCQPRWTRFFPWSSPTIGRLSPNPVPPLPHGVFFMGTFTIPDDQNMAVALTGVDDQGNPTNTLPVGSTVAWSSSDSSIVTAGADTRPQNAGNPLAGMLTTTGKLGSAQVTVTVNQPGGPTLTGQATVNVIASPPVAIAIQPGELIPRAGSGAGTGSGGGSGSGTGSASGSGSGP